MVAERFLYEKKLKGLRNIRSNNESYYERYVSCCTKSENADMSNEK